MAEPAGDIRDLLLDAANISVDQLPMLPVIFDRFSNNFAERLRHLAWTPPHLTAGGITATRVGEGASSFAVGREASYVNRTAALYRLVAGIPSDAEPPPAR